MWFLNIEGGKNADQSVIQILSSDSDARQDKELLVYF